MYKNYRILAFVPARKGSKGITDKNITILAEKPLIQYTFDLIKSIDIFDECFVSTDSEIIMDISYQNGFFKHDLRPSFLAEDKSILYDVMKYEIDKYRLDYSFDVIVLLQPTSPLRKIKTILEGIKMFLDSQLKSALGVTEVSDHPFFIRFIKQQKLIRLLPLDSTVRRQDLPNYYRINGAIYINFIKDILNNYISFNDNEFPIFFSKDESIDIDDMDDLKEAERIIKKF
jgi:CMP-N,N'-diacetyllegionaminic acid synthase